LGISPTISSPGGLGLPPGGLDHHHRLFIVLASRRLRFITSLENPRRCVNTSWYSEVLLASAVVLFLSLLERFYHVCPLCWVDLFLPLLPIVIVTSVIGKSPNRSQHTYVTGRIKFGSARKNICSKTPRIVGYCHQRTIVERTADYRQFNSKHVVVSYKD
jgi:hypothetical protein